MTKHICLVAVLIVLACAGCGVKGPPRPPDHPVELGRGQPTFKRATQEYAFPNVPSAEPGASPTPRPIDGN